MHIKSIHLDGFKSYQKHTEITGFSPEFNAITGYNGSGKSNVLDSICFILGINKLDNIRAKSMSELISHGGTKATVQIRFDNTNKRNSPFGMEHLDEVVVQRTITAQATGKGCATNYTLNGHAATNGKIQDFFRGIGLNVNNPHFLIMQGRITTVLNMKPEEILGMVEEAAGTKMYDQKKKDAEKTMFVKETKLREVDRIFEGSIDPRMDKFREDRKNMVEVTRLGKLKENAQRKYEAYQFYQTNENAQRDADNTEKVKKDIEELDKRVEAIGQDILEKERDKKDLENVRDNKDGEEDLGRAHTDKQTYMLQRENEKTQIVEAISKCKKESGRISKGIIKDRKVLESKRKDLEDSKSANSDDIQGHKDEEELVERYRNDLESLTRGTVTNEQGQHVSIETEIQDTRTKLATLDASMRTAQKRRERLGPTIGKLEDERKKLSAQNHNELNEVDNLEKKVVDLTSGLNKLGFDAVKDGNLRQKSAFLNDKIRDLEYQNNKLLQEYSNSRFALNYTPPPVPNFDEKKDLFGYIAHLVTIKPGCEKYALAAEIALGGLLGNIVVSNQDIARILIDSKAFNGRRTMVPASENYRQNKKCHIVSDGVLASAKKVAQNFGENVVRMIDLVDYPDFINNTFLSSLGNILVVETLDCARQVAYHDSVKTRTITVRGDDVKPSGVMTGGYYENSCQNVFLALAPWHDRNKEIAQCRRELESMDHQLRSTESSSRRYHEMNNQLETHQRKLASIKNNIKHSALGLVLKDIQDAKDELAEVEVELETNSKAMAVLNEKTKTLETLRSNDKSAQDKKKKELTALLQKAEKSASQNKDKAEKARRAVMQLQATVDDLEQSIKNDEAEWEKKKKDLDELEEKLPAAEEAFNQAQAEAEAALAELAALKENQRQVNSRLTKVTKEYDSLRREESKAKLKRDDLEKEMTRLYESEKANKKHAQMMLKKCEWLADEQVHFNKKGGLYDFDGYSTNRGTTEIKELTEKIEKLERCLCMKNVSNLDTCEAKVIDIKNKREKLNEDFNMLKKTISVLDKRKVDELVRAHQSVNKDFGTIFNCLLPDATATLVPPEGKNVWEGLEVKVAFNGVQKDSLHELSGGQRSLVALSLILAMLKFKPAPLYILDEVDAALDLSHTANIGMMIKTHFHNSQFIIVSLKQGMFSNADVLFQTHFADGHSTCTRLTGAALLKAKNDTKLAKQAQEMIDNEVAKKTSKKTPSKKATKPVEEEDSS